MYVCMLAVLRGLPAAPAIRKADVLICTHKFAAPFASVCEGTYIGTSTQTFRCTFIRPKGLFSRDKKGAGR